MSASDTLSFAAGSDKCCCCRCPKGCQNIGSLIPDCDAGEAAEYYQVGGFCGGVGPGGYWPCCPQIESAVGLLIPPPSGCVYSSFPITCGYPGVSGVTFTWQLDLAAAAGDPALKLVGSDGTVMVWKLPPSLRGTWTPLCSTILYRYGSEDAAGSVVGDPTYCFPPPRLCLSALGPCCPGRTDPLPRSLLATWTQLAPFGVPSCPCADGSTISLNWDPATKRWYGSATFCGSTMEMEIWCVRQIPQTATSFWGRLKITGPENCSTNAGPPGDRHPQWVDFAANTSGWAIAECDPFHLRSTAFSFDGCCLHNPSQLQLDVTE